MFILFSNKLLTQSIVIRSTLLFMLKMSFFSQSSLEEMACKKVLVRDIFENKIEIIFSEERDLRIRITNLDTKILSVKVIRYLKIVNYATVNVQKIDVAI